MTLERLGGARQVEADPGEVVVGAQHVGEQAALGAPEVEHGPVLVERELPCDRDRGAGAERRHRVQNLASRSGSAYIAAKKSSPEQHLRALCTTPHRRRHQGAQPSLRETPRTRRPPPPRTPQRLTPPRTKGTCTETARLGWCGLRGHRSGWDHLPDHWFDGRFDNEVRDWPGRGVEHWCGRA